MEKNIYAGRSQAQVPKTNETFNDQKKKKMKTGSNRLNKVKLFLLYCRHSVQLFINEITDVTKPTYRNKS